MAQVKIRRAVAASRGGRGPVSRRAGVRVVGLALALSLLATGSAVHAQNPGIFIERQSTDCIPGATCGATSTSTSVNYNNYVVSSSGSNHYIVVGVTVALGSAVADSCNLSASYNGTSLSRKGQTSNGSKYCRMAIFGGVVSSGLGSGHTVTGSVSGCSISAITVSAASFTNVLGSSVGTYSSATGTSATMSVNVTSAQGQMVVDTACNQAGAADADITAGSSPYFTWYKKRYDSNYGAASASVKQADSGSDTTTTMSYSVTGTSRDWAIGGFALKPANGSVIKLDRVIAFGSGPNLKVNWQTGSEVDNLGFNVYRDVGFGRVRINRAPIIGSALLAGAGVSLAAGNSYSLDDFLAPSAGPRPTYWLEDIDLNGRSTLHGPIRPIELTALPQDGPVTHATYTLAEDPPANLEPEAPFVVPPVLARGESPAMQWKLAASRAVKIGIDRDGWYELSGAELRAAGLAVEDDPRALTLFADGKELPIEVRAGEDGVLDPGDVVGFYGTRLNAAATDTRVYWLAPGLGAAPRIGQATLPAAAGAEASSYPADLEWRPRSLYVPALINGDDDNFFGPLVGVMPLTQSFAIPAEAAVGAATLEVGVQGVSYTAHEISVEVGGQEVGKIALTDRERKSGTFVLPAVPPGTELVVGLRASGEADKVLVDFVRLTHPRRFVAKAGRLGFTAPAGGAVTLAGFAPNEEITVIDVTAAERPELVRRAAANEQGELAVLVPGGTGRRRLLARGGTAVQPTRLLAGNRASRWNEPAAGGDLVIIGPAALLPAFAPLIELRKAEGWSPITVELEDVYDEFSFGTKQPAALRVFIARAVDSWQKRPRAIIFAGDATLDPRDFLGKGSFDQMPTKVVATHFIETASDDWFADLDDDGAADVPIGRIPARSGIEAAAIVKKLVAAPVFRSAEAAAAASPLAFVAGNSDNNYDFVEVASSLRGRVPTPFRALALDRDLPGLDRTAQLRQALAARPAVVSYAGHGSQELWAGGLLNAAMVPELGDDGPGAFWLDLTCLNGFFHDAQKPSLAELLLARPAGGAFGIWASSSLTEVNWHRTLGRAFLDDLLSRGVTVGEATRRAKLAVSDMDTRRSWILFGDPSWQLRAFTPEEPPADPQPDPHIETDGGAAPDATDSPDAGAPDTAAPSGPGQPDAATENPAPGADAGGCACTLASSPRPPASTFALALLFAALLARRKR